MSKKDPTEKKIENGKKAAKLANKKLAKRKVEKEAKRLADKSIMEMASDMNGGQGNSFVKLHAEHRKAEEQIAAAQKWKRNVRAQMKGMKVDMSCYDRVNKLSKMDPADVTAKKATEALYEKQLSLPLSEDQKKMVAEIDTKRENARAAMADLNGGETGKEIGSGTEAPEPTPETMPEPTTEPAKESEVPERNDAIAASFQSPQETVAVTH